MTTGVPMTSTFVCPVPPADFSARDIPIKYLDLALRPLRRIHRTSRDPIHYNKAGGTGSRFRFDAPNDEYGTLYASQEFDACVAETIVRDRFVAGALPLQIEENELAQRSISTLTVAGGILKLADLTEAILHLGCTAEVLSHSDYTAPNLWSRALQQHPAMVDGIIFRSRYANKESVAIFDRTTLIQVGASTELLSSGEMADYLDRFNIGLL